MGIEGFERNLSEESKKALQSETWKKVRDGMKEKKEVKHFTAENIGENAYGWIWDQVIKEYLRRGYNVEDNSPDIVVMGETYKTLRRPEVTVFYDAAGDTLFDVTNERLEKEYEWLIKQRAKEKLKKELAAAKDKSFADPIIGYLVERCQDDEGLAEDVVQEHKTWQKCFDYIYRQARKQAKGNCAAVRDDVVYEWAEDYYHKDDKAEEAEKARKGAERKEKQKKTADDRVSKAKKNPAKVDPAPEKKEDKSKEQTKSKKNNKDMEGQLDIFSMMGM